MIKKFLYLLIFVLIQVSVRAVDYYRVLGIRRNANKKQIKKAYKKGALKWHPDKNSDNLDRAQAKFIELTKAYDVLSDDKLKSIYDRHGEAGLKQHEEGQQQRKAQQQHFGNFGEMFNFNFGGRQRNFGFGGQQQQSTVDFFHQNDVVELNIQSLSKFYRRQNVWVILFFKPNEQESKNMKDTWATLSSKLYGIVTVAGVNCEEDEEICDEFEAYGCPTIFVAPANIKFDYIKYTGQHTLGKIASFAVKQMENFAQVVTEANYERFISEQQNKIKVLLFTKKSKTSPLLKALSKEYLKTLVFGEIRQNERGLVQKFRINKFPQFFVLTDVSTLEGVVYEGALKKDQIKKFLNTYSYKSQDSLSSGGQALFLSEKQYFNNNCNEKDKTMCFIYVYSKNLFDTQDTQGQLEFVKKAAQMYKKDKLKFYYTDTDNFDYVETYEQEEPEKPYILIVKGKRQRSSLYQGQMSYEAFELYIDSLLGGNIKFQRMKFQLQFKDLDQKQDL